MKILIGILLGALLVLCISQAHATSNKEWNIPTHEGKGNRLLRIQDGNVNCYIVQWYKNIDGISCVKVK